MDAALIAEAQKWGLNNYLDKPFTTVSMKACIEKVVGRLS